ncbi:hypothetical protein [Methylovirgula sp. 4M-Z18]|uniref:hypothetical protein n=1 Tax=Methylovirgula sp. 4M-Z18 TaxID=2293567 RepID=UPI000E2FDC8B|nr:hypothetical protein [Methylovirgula sp. 4M-Z18]RFB80381.1 hypothetical protein DYH55_02315 [Methylovirgula sp. 4M-Z18]
MEIISQILGGLSAVAAIAAAIIWFKSAQVNTPQEFKVEVLVELIHNSDNVDGSHIFVGGHGTSRELESLGNAMIEQSRLSGRAAIWAGASALLQGGAIVAHLFAR